jgi:hypothetical protein
MSENLPSGNSSGRPRGATELGIDCGGDEPTAWHGIGSAGVSRPTVQGVNCLFRVVFVRRRVFGLLNEGEGRDRRVVPFGHQLAADIAVGIVLIAGRTALDRDLIDRAAVWAGMGLAGTGPPCWDHALNVAQPMR